MSRRERSSRGEIKAMMNNMAMKEVLKEELDRLENLGIHKSRRAGKGDAFVCVESRHKPCSH